MFLHKIAQINMKVKEKLVELNIYQETKKSWQDIPLFEETLKSLINKPEINVEVLLMYLAMSSRLRFLKEFQEDGNKYQLLQHEVKETLQELINASRPENQTKHLIDTDLNLKLQSRASDTSALSIQQLMSYPLRTTTMIPPIVSKHTMFDYSDSETTPLSKPLEATGERIPIPSPSFNQSNNGRKTPVGRLAQDIRKKKELIEKGDCSYKDQLLKDLTLKKPNFRIGSNVEGISNREKPKGKRIKRSGFHDLAYKGVDLSTQESEVVNNTPGVRTKSFTSGEKLLKIEAESIRLKSNGLILNGRQVSQDDEENRDYFNVKASVELKNETISNRQDADIQKIQEYFQQKMHQIELQRKVRLTVPDSLLLSQKTMTSSQIIDNNPSSKSGDTHVKISNIVKGNNEPVKEEAEPKPVKSNLPESLRHYDILNIEYRPQQLLSKTYSKRGLADRIYAELLDYNCEIKKIIKTYFTNFPFSRPEFQNITTEQQTEQQESNLLDSYKKPLKPLFKQAIKSRRSTSTDNAQSYRKVSKNIYYKFCKDLRPPTENEISSSRGSVPQIKGTVVQKNILAKIQNPKPIQKLPFVLPKLGLIDPNKNSNETHEVEVLSLNINSNPNALNNMNTRENQPAQLIAFKKLASKRTQESEVEEQRGLMSATSSNQQLNAQTVTRLTTNQDLSFEILPDEMNNSAFEFENCESRRVNQKANTEDSLVYDTFRRKIKSIGAPSAKKKKFPEINNRPNKFNLDLRKSCAATPDNLIKISPSRLILHEDYS